MAGQAFTGTGGSVKVVGTPSTSVGQIRQFQVQIQRGSYDAPVLGDSWVNKVQGLGSWSGSLEGWFDPTDDTGQTLLQNAILNQTTVYLELDSGDGIFEGQAIPNSYEVTVPEDGIVAFTFSFDGTGALAFS